MSTALASRRQVDPATKWKPVDGLRLRRWRSLVDAGDSEDGAWLTVVTDPALGYRSWRGKDRVPANTLASSLAKFLRRAAPAMIERHRDKARIGIATASGDAVEAITRIQRGDFGEDDDPRAQLAAAKLTLQTLGIISSGGNTTHVDARTAVQVNHVEVSRDQLRTIAGDADTLQRALALAASLEAAPGEPAGEAD